MNEEIINLSGDHKEVFYQLGLKEKESFLSLEKEISSLVSKINFLSIGNTIISRSKIAIKKKDSNFYDECLEAYSDGLGMKIDRYKNLMQIFEFAGHYGQIYPELKNLIPGCTSLLQKTEDGICHSRLFDFPLINLTQSKKRIYFWNFKNKESFLSLSFEGLSPLIFQSIHSQNYTLSLHHKSSNELFSEGESIGEIIFSTLSKSKTIQEAKEAVSRFKSQAKWGLVLCQINAKVLHLDIEGPKVDFEYFDLNDSSPLVVTNLSLKSTPAETATFSTFCKNRERFVLKNINSNKKHPLDLLTELPSKKAHTGVYPALTHSTILGVHFNLTKGYFDIKKSDGVISQSDSLLRYSLNSEQNIEIIKEAQTPNLMEVSWKSAAKAQGLYDQKIFDLAYHELQMAINLCPHETWKNILSFYLSIWEFQFLSNETELALVYKKLLKLKVPQELESQHKMMIFRFEKRLKLALTISADSLPQNFKNLFQIEKGAPIPVFTAWMKLLYPRLDILDVLTPYFK